MRRLILWLLRRLFIFFYLKTLRLWNFLWRCDYRRCIWRIRTNVRARWALAAFDYEKTLPLRIAIAKAMIFCQEKRTKLKILLRTVSIIILCIFCLNFKMPWTLQHMAIISTNYFPYSAKYSENTMVILFNGHRRFWPPKAIVCTSQNGTHSLAAIARVRYAFTPIMICGWTVYLALCPVVTTPQNFSLQDTRFSSKQVQIPYQTTSYEKMSVVACFSPLFYNERWQLIVPTLEIYRQMGVTLQVYYIQSMIVEILEFMQAYEALKVVKLETWNRISVMDPNNISTLNYDPNAELEWRNQAASHTDCLLKHKKTYFLDFWEAAEFIIVSDLDDVLFPKLGATFLDEFRALSLAHPSATGFSYNRYNTELITSKNPADFSLASLINSARVATEWEDPKYVVRPARVQSVWLHWPGIIDRGRMYQVPNEQNFMLHFRNWTLEELGPTLIPRTQRFFQQFKYQIGDMIHPAMTMQIEQNFRQFLTATANLTDLFDRLPQKIVYYPMIAECYNRIFYGRGKHPVNCPGPLRCELPPVPGLRCAVSRKTYGHEAINRNLLVHFPRDKGEFFISDSGCSI